jgi:hypothetical protein
MSWISRQVVRGARPIVAVAALMLVLSVVSLYRFSADPIEYDFSKLSSRSSQRRGSGFWARKVDAVFGRYLTPTVILASSDGGRDRIVDALKARRKREGANTTLDRVETLESTLPPRQAEKLAIINEIQKMYWEKIRQWVGDDQRKGLDKWIPVEPLKEIRAADLPAEVTRRFADVNGRTRPMVLVYPTLDLGQWQSRRLRDYARALREEVFRASPDASIASGQLISTDMIDAIITDGPRITMISFLGVVILVVVLFRGAKLSGFVLAALWSGVLLLAGALGALGLKINFLNFVALPITFGIGVDYAVNVFARYRLDGEGSIQRAVANTGGAVFMCSWTTIVGYTSLLLADNRALSSFGLVAVLGEFACLATAVIALPAFIVLLERRRRRKG